MRRAVFVLADLIAAVVLALLLIDPARDLTIVFVLLAVAGLLWLVAE